MTYTIDRIANIVSATAQLPDPAQIVQQLVYDSRRIQQPETSLFFALKTTHANGYRFVEDAYKKGVRAFVVSEPVLLEGANVILVSNVLQALQTLAAFHRSQFSFPVIGITGSNGKTVVKEWLNSLLEPDFHIVRSPKSFNSQIGVPLSVWQMEPQHTLGIFEAGISQGGEMDSLEKIIRPTIGVLTNLGEAHSEGFASAEEKLHEKLTLFDSADVVIGEATLLSSISKKKFTWSRSGAADLQITGVQKQRGETLMEAIYNARSISLRVPFTDDASIENSITCWCVLLQLSIAQNVIAERISRLHAVDMRLQLNHAINDCLVINDSYSADVTSLRIALDFMAQQSAGRKRTVILSDFFESGKSNEALYAEITHLLTLFHIKKVIAIGAAIGPALQNNLPASTEQQVYASTEDFLQQFKSSVFGHEIILLKGARKAGFERIAQVFEEKLHGTVLQINLAALTHNLKQYQQRLKPSTKIMAMVKAFSYGSGGAEIASVLQYNNVAYLAVAYADEGIELVQAGVHLPIMVMNPEPSAFASIVEYNLQPALFSTALLHRFDDYVKSQGLTAYPVHLEVETGMNRLGISFSDIKDVAQYFGQSTTLHLQSAFSHLAASEEPRNDQFTQEQAARFAEAVQLLRQFVSYPFLQHISNSAAIVRHPHLQLDMVRLGIGLYGVEPDAEEALDLQPVATLRSTVAQVREIVAGESVSYNRRGVVNRNSRIATVRIGYADGYSRRFGNGVGRILINGCEAPVIGTVCMDMTMVDVTDIEGVKEGDDVVVFGLGLAVQEVAAMIGTIPYEIMTGVSQRVKRVYYYE